MRRIEPPSIREYVGALAFGVPVVEEMLAELTARRLLSLALAFE